MRTFEEIKNEYKDLCAKAGQLQFRIKESEKELETFNKRLKELQAEADSLPKAENPKNG
jgi:chromosome segregation ATPase